MSYNIDSADVRVLDAWMTAKDVAAALRELDLPEVHFLEDLEEPAQRALEKGKPGTRIQLRGFDWGGEGSGSTFEDTFQKQLATSIRGTLEVVLTWEGGDSTSAFRVEDGVYEECDVEVKVKRKKKAQRT